MMRMLRSIILSASAGFLIPTLAFATMDTVPQAAAPIYSFELSYEDAEGAIGFALAEKGAGNKVLASITGDKKTEALFTYGRPITVEIRALKFDTTTKRWNASLMFVNEGTIVSAMPVTGRFEEVVEVPVLKRQVKNGDVIKASDIEIRDIAVSRTRSDTITDISSLVGKSPERSISPSRPIREAEIASPVLIKKNALVQMRYSSPGMEITATGQALEEGGKGSMISVRNLASKKLVRAQVADGQTVNIINSTTQASATAGTDSYAN